MASSTTFHTNLCLVRVALLLLFPANAFGQSLDSVLNRLDEAQLDSAASHAAQKIRNAILDEEPPSVLVIDFFRGSVGTSSRLGTLLADRFSESLAANAGRLRILDRGILRDYLTKEWTTLEDLQSNDVCLRVGRQLGATGVVVGTLYEENDQISLTFHLEGFGRLTKEADVFRVTDERVRFVATDEKHTMLLQPGPKYVRTADDIPEEPGVARAGSDGVTWPHCIDCPDPDFSEAARAAKFQGTVRLSIVVTAEGNVTAIYVLKGAPFGLTAKAIEAVRRWHLKPAEKDGKAVSVRVEAESTFRLF